MEMISPTESSIFNLNDKEIALKMRSDNYEQFKLLVRMHLSFELELTTEVFDLPCDEYIYYEKCKMKKWTPIQKNKIKSRESAGIQLSTDLIAKLLQLKNYLLANDNIKQEGIFRRNGLVSRQNELKSLLTKSDSIDFNAYSVYECATVFKGILGNLSQPLLTEAHYTVHCAIADLCREFDKQGNDKEKEENHILSIVQMLMLLLPRQNSYLLQNIIEMLNTTAKYEKFNKMNSNTLATLFSIHLICPRDLPPAVLCYIAENMTPVIRFLIAHGRKIFDIPSKLAKDIWAHYKIKHKRTIPLEYPLVASNLDDLPVDTIYTFVNRAKTIEENKSNTTEQALASLYEYIQGLPESSKKRRLIKNFKKQNRQDQTKNTQSASSSITKFFKKHSKTKLKKTKPSDSFSTSNISTPNSVPTKSFRLRLLSHKTDLNITKKSENATTNQLMENKENHDLNFNKLNFKLCFEKSLLKKTKLYDLYQSSVLKSKYDLQPNSIQRFYEGHISPTFNSQNNSLYTENSFDITFKNKLIDGVEMKSFLLSHVKSAASATVQRSNALLIKISNGDQIFNKFHVRDLRELINNRLPIYPIPKLFQGIPTSIQKSIMAQRSAVMSVTILGTSAEKNNSNKLECDNWDEENNNLDIYKK